MRKRTLARRLPAILWRALSGPVALPGVVLLFLLLNLVSALVVAVPARSLLSVELDHNLYGERMEAGASWRWFDTVERRHPQAVGDGSPWTALFSDEGVRWSDLAAVSGPPAAVLLAGVLLFLLHGPLHVGYLAARRRGAHGPRAVVADALTHLLPGLALALLAAAAYAAVYAAVYVAPARPLARFAELMQGEVWHLAQVWLRLGLTLLLLLVVKVFVDLAKLGVVEPGGAWGRLEGAAARPRGWRGGRLPGALALAGRELWRRGWAYGGVDLLLALALLVLGALWWVASAPLVPETWLGIAILFVLHQVVLALRIVLRLAHLDAARGIFAAAHAAPPAPTTPPPPTPPPG
jgi:hypothetical protein